MKMLKSHTISLSPSLPILQIHPNLSFPCTTITLSSNTHSFPPLRRSFPLPCRQNPIFQVVRCAMEEDRVLEVEEAELLMETCITRILPPALTLHHGLGMITEAVEELKLNPPSSAAGMLRFQVAVPPSSKALNWFCCQPESSEVFPQFFLSKEKEIPTVRSLYLNGTRGVFGIGAAVYVHGSSGALLELSSSKSYPSVDLTLVRAYVFMDINFDTKSSSMKHKTGSHFLFIPQIELDEFEDISILAATLAWNDCSLGTFESAVESYQASLSQVRHQFWNTTEKWHNKCIRSALRNFNVVEDENFQMVCIDAFLLGGRDSEGDSLKLKEASVSCQFCVRLSPTMAIAKNMLDHANDMSDPVRDSANINALWASLIVEECSRLGLTYFCVAPGSRSSPLAVAASSHPLTTCIVCFDERSLSYHAIGYARGSYKPAIVITSSGTAVSNLLPAVVEASQDFVPLLLLTADRPPELHDAGANQTINQVNHFGSFVRFFYGLPAPNDGIPARMVLTTIDSAVNWATSSPYGPVHINCPFREPLDNSSREWMLSCLKGLDFWMSSAEPFTNYIQLQHSYACDNIQGQISEVLKVIQGANRGLLLLGAIHTEDDIWAALLLAKHLSWPVVADILSGLSLRKYFASFAEIEDNFLFVDHLDHFLLSDSVRSWAQPDVIVQIGRRITSKRISEMLEECFPFTYIMVDKHPSRHDPSHIVTHRIQSTITQFADCLLKALIPPVDSRWSYVLRALDMMVAWEISFLIHSQYSLTEPYVAHIIPEALCSETAIFVGNSMSIRDADMYGCNWSKSTESIAAWLSSHLPCKGIPVAGNRGASGIDGLLSTAVGFSVGCNKRVLCVIGDVSFLHDTNGLALLKQRILRKPLTIIVINNHGGAIFSLLPIADRIEQRVLDQYFYTSHTISVRNLCAAHGVRHVHARTKMELQHALFTSQQEKVDSVIEIESCIEANATFHSYLRNFARQAADHALRILSRFSSADYSLYSVPFCKISKMEYSLYRIQLCAPPTYTSVNCDSTGFYKEGFIVTLSLEDGIVGFGEVAPLEIHKENLFDVEQQLRYFIHIVEGAKINYLLTQLKGSFSSWLWNSLGILPGSVFPSVRCGLEMAVLNAIAARCSSSLLDVLHPLSVKEEFSERSLNVQICALIDSNGTPSEVAHIATKLVQEGFTALKLKVARRGDPIEDAIVIQEVRKKVGQQITLRVDANRKWTYEEAIQFGSCVRDCDLQYIEEPVEVEDDILNFCEETGLPVALDETIDNIQENPCEMLAKFTHSGVVAVVIKPSVVGGFENAALIARWAQQLGKMSVVSAAFESGLSLATYIQFSSYLELRNAETCRVMNKEQGFYPPTAHGLGTYRWLKEDITTEPLNIGCDPYGGFVEASVIDADKLLKKFEMNRNANAILRTITGERSREYQLQVASSGYSFSVNVQEIGPCIANDIIVFLHGFLGTGEDWISIMKAISGSTRCIAIDLPGHGKSKMQNHAGKESVQEPNLSMEVVSDILCKMIHCITPGRVTLVGYSMGARISLYMALKCSDKVERAVMISGSPGLKDVGARKVRRDKDDFRACFLVTHGLELFLDTWYTGDLWYSLRSHPHFKQVVASRLQHEDVNTLAKALSDLSVGRQPSLWEDLKHCKVPLLLIVGERDKKFKRIAQEMFSEICHGTRSRDDSEKKMYEMVEIPHCGHAVHIENPLAVISAVGQFLTRKRSLTLDPEGIHAACS